MIDLDRYSEFLIKHDITPNQFLFLWFILHRKYSLLYKYCETKSAFTQKEISGLVDKNFIDKPKDAQGSALFADDFEVTNHFRKLLFVEEPEAMFEEFWCAYPNFLFINSKRVPTKGTNKEDLEQRYIKLIANNLPLHISIMNAVEWGRLNGYLNTGILKFYDSVGWEAIHEEMRGSVEQGELPSQNEF